MEPIFAKYAARYAAQGLAVFPLAKNSKVPPKGSHGVLEATTDLAKIAEWSKRDPYANIGVATGKISRVSIVDIDPKNGGFETERGFRKERKFWSDTPVSRTRSGGRHIWMDYHPALVTGTNRLGAGIDIRNDGGYVVAPPSVVDGRKYSWLYWPKTGFAAVPGWVLAYLDAERRKRDAGAAERAKGTVTVDRESLGDLERRRYSGLAASALTRLAGRLVHQTKPGRGRELFTCCCFMKPYISGGFIQEVTVRKAFESACRTNKLVDENGIVDVRKTMTAAFARATDQLPDLSKLEDRPFERRAA